MSLFSQNKLTFKRLIRAQIGVFFSVGLILFVLGYVLDIKILQGKIQQTQLQRKGFEQKLQQEKNRITRYKEEEQSFSLLQQQYVNEIKKFTRDLNFTTELNILEKLAADAQIEIISIEPQILKEDGDELFSHCAIKIEATGQYGGLIKFIRDILKQDYFVVFDDLILEKKESSDFGNNLNLQGSIVFYGRKVSGPKIIGQKILFNGMEHGRDIFAQGTNKSGLFLWSNSELRFLGVIKNGNENLGIVCDPLGAIYRVQVGDKIGLKQNKILSIDEWGIVTDSKAQNVLGVNK